MEFQMAGQKVLVQRLGYKDGGHILQFRIACKDANSVHVSAFLRISSALGVAIVIKWLRVRKSQIAKDLQKFGFLTALNFLQSCPSDLTVWMSPRLVNSKPIAAFPNRAIINLRRRTKR